MAEDTAQALTRIREKAAQADRERAAAEVRVVEAQRRLKEIDDQIQALGVKPDEAEAQVAALDAQLAQDLAALDRALDAELAAYRALA